MYACIICGEWLPEDHLLEDPIKWFEDHRVSAGHVCSRECKNEFDMNKWGLSEDIVNSLK